MLKPTENEIWRVLNDDAPYDVSQRVAEWFSSEEGGLWLSVNSSKIFRLVEEGVLKVDEDVPSDTMLDYIHAEIARRVRKLRRLTAVWRVAAVFIPVAAIVSLWLEVDSRIGGSVFSEPEMVAESSEMGERKVVIFQDGTKVYLNAGATVTYPKWWRLDKRHVKLVGEAYFEVAENSRRPFTVDIFDTKVKVHGTKFNIKAYPEDNDINVTLLEGSVSFEADGQEHGMMPSQLLTYDRTDRSVNMIRLDRPDDNMLWTKNIIRFRNSSLSEVLETIGRWYDVQFVIRDSSLLSRTFTFKTTQLPLNTLLEEIEYISDMKFELKGDIVEVSRK